MKLTPAQALARITEISVTDESQRRELILAILNKVRQSGYSDGYDDGYREGSEAGG